MTISFDATGLDPDVLAVLVGADGVPEGGVLTGEAARRAQFWAEVTAETPDDSPALRAEVARLVLRELATARVPEVQSKLPIIRLRATATLRARGEAAPATLRRGDGAVALHRRRQPYSHYFAVVEDDLQFTRFDGTLSAPVTRAGFLMGDAATVLPYDPVRDRVLLVEQFRHGPYVRGDANPWTLEPVAGRVDAGEDPAEAIRREALEEAGVTLQTLHHVGSYYPSPGAVSEFLYSYVGLCDLPDGTEGIGGLEAEDEDIRSHVIPRAHLMELIASGEALNGPLLLTAWWLEQNRADLTA